MTSTSAAFPVSQQTVTLHRLLTSVIFLAAVAATVTACVAVPARPPLVPPLPLLLAAIPVLVLGLSLRPERTLVADLAFIVLLPVLLVPYAPLVLLACACAAGIERGALSHGRPSTRAFNALSRAANYTLACLAAWASPLLVLSLFSQAPASVAGAPPNARVILGPALPLAAAAGVVAFLGVEALLGALASWVLSAPAPPGDGGRRVVRLVLDFLAVPLVIALTAIIVPISPLAGATVICLVAALALVVGLLLRALRKSRAELFERDAALRARGSESRALQTAARALAADSGGESALRIAAAQAAAALPCDLQLVVHFDRTGPPGNARVSLADAQGLEISLPRARTERIATLLFSLDGPARLADRLGGPAGSAPLRALAGVASELGARAAIASPVSTGGSTAGVIALFSTRPREWDARAAEVLGALCAQAGLALDSAAASVRAAHDPLTGLLRRDGFFRRLDEEINRARRYGSSISVLMLDVDSFKLLNDTHGHSAGDEMLRRVSDTIRESLRGPDVPARYGGEEFSVLLPECDEEGALALAERIRTRVERIEIRPLDGGGVPIRTAISIGFVSRTGDWAGDGQSLVDLADRALYEAKRSGGNRVVGTV